MGKILLPKGGTQLAVGFKYTLKVEYQLRGPRLLFYPPPYMSMTSLLLYGNCSVDGTAVFPRISVKTEESHILPGFHFMGEKTGNELFLGWDGGLLQRHPPTSALHQRIQCHVEFFHDDCSWF